MASSTEEAAVATVAGEASRMAGMGYSVIPLGERSKRPPQGFRWDEFARRRASAESVGRYFAANPAANFGVVCGRVSNLLVVDIDVKHADPAGAMELAELVAFSVPDPSRPAPTAETGSGGFHVYFASSAVQTSIGIDPAALGIPGATPSAAGCGATVDLKSERSYVVAPPSLHPDTGRAYRWIVPPVPAIDLPPCPDWLLAAGRRPGQARSSEEWERALEPAQGSRHGSALSVAGLLLSRLPEDLWRPVAVPLVRAWNAVHVVPPLPDRELDVILRDLMRKESMS